jgi:hypothetical protein
MPSVFPIKGYSGRANKNWERGKYMSRLREGNRKDGDGKQWGRSEQDRKGEQEGRRGRQKEDPLSH